MKKTKTYVMQETEILTAPRSKGKQPHACIVGLTCGTTECRSYELNTTNGEEQKVCYKSAIRHMLHKEKVVPRKSQVD
jgi:hypothetical protein